LLPFFFGAGKNIALPGDYFSQRFLAHAFGHGLGQQCHETTQEQKGRP
jgi:hypothetical protein